MKTGNPLDHRTFPEFLAWKEYLRADKLGSDFLWIGRFGAALSAATVILAVHSHFESILLLPLTLEASMLAVVLAGRQVAKKEKEVAEKKLQTFTGKPPESLAR